MRGLFIAFSVSLTLGGLVSCSRDEPARRSDGDQPAASTGQATSKIFLFSPPVDFRDREQYWSNHHYVTAFGAGGFDTRQMLRFEQTYLNFSQSAYDPKTDSLFTWKKNYNSSDHLMQVKLPLMEVTPVARFPRGGDSPLLAMDTRRKRILVTPEYGRGLEALRGGKLRNDYSVYDIKEGRWESGRLDRIGLVTVSFSEALDRFVALGTVPPGGSEAADDNVYLFHIAGDGKVSRRVRSDLLTVLNTPLVTFSPDDSLGNHPGLQSRVLGDRIHLIRFLNLGRGSRSESYKWSYELYSIDVSTGESRFERSFP